MKYDCQNNQPAVVTGMGIVSSAGVGVGAFNQMLYEGQVKFSLSNHVQHLSFPVVAAEMPRFNFEKELNNFLMIPSSILRKAHQAARRAPLGIQVALLAALEAWQQANMSEREIARERIGIIVAGHMLARNYQYQAQANANQDFDYLSPTYALHCLDTDHIGILSEVLDIKGEGMTVGAASASGNVALLQGQRLLQQGIVDVCIVVGGLADISPLEIQGFYNINALGGKEFASQPLSACRPFDIAHEGFVLGQASACIVLEKKSYLNYMTAANLGEIAGGAVLLDANRLANPTVEGEKKVMEQALLNAKINKDQIQYINTHGTGTPLGDQVEIEAIQSVFNHTLKNIWLNSTKSLVGHCLWSAGIVEAIAVLLQMNGNYLHSQPNLDNPIDMTLKFTKKQREQANIDFAISNSFGFGGINTCIVIKKARD